MVSDRDGVVSMSQASSGHDDGDHDDGEAGDGGGGREPQITWVGQQWQMDGYCGRATTAAAAAEPQPVPAAPPMPADTQGVRPIAVVRTRPSQGRVVRIGPPRESATASVS
jgi:hypothetical protein